MNIIKTIQNAWEKHVSYETRFRLPETIDNICDVIGRSMFALTLVCVLAFVFSAEVSAMEAICCPR